jgi:hypothetical protein
VSDSHAPPPHTLLPGDQIGQLIAAVRDFYTANGRWPLGTELTDLGPPSSGPGLNPTAVSSAPGAESGPGLNPATTAGPPDQAPEAPAAPSAGASKKPAARRRPRRRSSR